MFWLCEKNLEKEKNFGFYTHFIHIFIIYSYTCTKKSKQCAILSSLDTKTFSICHISHLIKGNVTVPSRGQAGGGGGAVGGQEGGICIRAPFAKSIFDFKKGGAAIGRRGRKAAPLLCPQWELEILIKFLNFASSNLQIHSKNRKVLT